MISITGSTRAGILVAQAAATTVKRVAQELGGKSPNMILPDADLSRAVPFGSRRRLPQSWPVMQRADAHACVPRANVRGRGSRRAAASELAVGDPLLEPPHMVRSPTGRNSTASRP